MPISKLHPIREYCDKFIKNNHNVDTQRMCDTVKNMPFDSKKTADSYLIVDNNEFGQSYKKSSLLDAII